MKDELDDFKISKKTQKLLQDKELLKKELNSGKSAQEIMGFSDKAMAKFYKAARYLFDNGRFAGSADAFLFLATLNPYNYEYWLGLGMSLQRCNEFESAIDAYELAAICQPDTPVPYFYLAKCFFAIHDRVNADKALDLALEYAGDIDEYAELKRQAKQAKALLSKDMKHKER
jgi:type III secretion system low calcium response chaperone LcrH/SycD